MTPNSLTSSFSSKKHSLKVLRKLDYPIKSNCNNSLKTSPKSDNLAKVRWIIIFIKFRRYLQIKEATSFTHKENSPTFSTKYDHPVKSYFASNFLWWMKRQTKKQTNGQTPSYDDIPLLAKCKGQIIKMIWYA